MLQSLLFVVFLALRNTKHVTSNFFAGVLMTLKEQNFIAKQMIMQLGDNLLISKREKNNLRKVKSIHQRIYLKT